MNSRIDIVQVLRTAYVGLEPNWMADQWLFNNELISYGFNSGSFHLRCNNLWVWLESNLSLFQFFKCQSMAARSCVWFLFDKGIRSCWLNYIYLWVVSSLLWLRFNNIYSRKSCRNFEKTSRKNRNQNVGNGEESWNGNKNVHNPPV